MSDADRSRGTTANPAENIASLDGIRAVAVSLVFLAHGGLSGIVPGGLGVTMFFVLSGFLITTLMRVEYAAAGRLDWRSFYLRRFVRLMPPLLLVMALSLSLTAVDGGGSPPTVGGIVSVILYFSNYFSIVMGEGIPDGLGVTWSLAVEEHFYIVFPLAALLLLKSTRRASVAVLGGLCLAILAWRCWLMAHGAPSGRIYMGTDTRIDSILIGCAMALACNPVLDPIPEPVRRHAGSIGAGALAVLLGTLLLRSDYFRWTYRFSIQSLAFAPLIYLAAALPRHAAYRWLNWGPLIYLGRISYTVYLAHETCLIFVNQHWPGLGMVPSMATTAIFALAIAVPMRLCVEIPFARIRRRLQQWRLSTVPEIAATT